MSRARRAAALLVALAPMVAVPVVAAQEDVPHVHGEGRLGRVVFPVSCTPEAQRRFAHAMAGLHSFWWEEGERAFGAVLEADSSCAMAQWGRALNAWGNPFAGGPTGPSVDAGSSAAALAAARPLPTPREQGFVNAVAALYRDAASTPSAVRLQAYADTMARLHRDLPRDVEVTIFHALALVATAPRTDTTFAQQRKAVALLNPLYRRYPDHPGLAHYIIHSTDSPVMAADGLAAARAYAKIAPAAPHAQHMPSHIFVRLGLWDETVTSNWRSYQAGIEHARATSASHYSTHELHALDYAVYGHLQRGQDSAARHAVATGRTLDVPRNRSAVVGEYSRVAMAARLLLERDEWAAAAAFPAPDDSASAVGIMLSRFTRAIGAARSGQREMAESEVAALDALARELEAKPDQYWARVTGIKRDAATAWIRFQSGDTAGGLALAAVAADTEDVTDKHPTTPAELLPARELEADMLLAAGRPAAALRSYRATLVREPGRARSLYGAARSAELAGDRAVARRAYTAYLAAMKPGDGTRPELARARTFLQHR